MRNIALVPQSNVFERGERVGTHQAREPANLLAADRVAFVRHGGTAALAAAKGLLGFANFGALQMADFERNAFERRGDDRETVADSAA